MFMLILLAFGWSNECALTLGMIASASVERNPRLNGRRKDADVAAIVASFCIVDERAIGGLIGPAVTGALSQCDPFN